MKKFRLTSLALLLMGGVILNSCNKNSNNDDPNNPTGQGGGPDDQYKIVITTEKAIGEEISIYYSPFTDSDSLFSTNATSPKYLEKVRPLWIDFNNNGIREEEEFGTTFEAVEGIVGSQTITIYGKVTYLMIKGQKITSIDTSQNSYLEKLVLYDNTFIESLDVTHNPNLKELDVLTYEEGKEKGGLKSLSLSADKNPKLKKIWIYGKEMNTLDISNFPELGSISVDGKIKNLKVNNNPKIKNLQFNYCDKMESIDVSNSPGLEDLSILCHTANPDLKKVNVVNTPKLKTFNINVSTLVNSSYDVSFCVQADADRVNNIPKDWEKGLFFDNYGKKYRVTINYQTTPCP